jgi:hypothetical protein
LYAIFPGFTLHLIESLRGTLMTPPISLNRYLTTMQAAEILSLSARTLERMRIDGSGPAAPQRRSQVPFGGRRRFTDWALPHVGTPGVQMALRNHVFDALGLPRLYLAR